ncbi:unnamed protein product [Prorocentrum cordatum]|uniref:Uncharacterized protein n=1 Tax=Prorocentrum cordatum TaxID=2364126 RepID=A0ABN9VZM5_9DINO|nr:unnamed protein product [Polarella glacialis]
MAWPWKRRSGLAAPRGGGTDVGATELSPEGRPGPGQGVVARGPPAEQAGRGRGRGRGPSEERCRSANRPRRADRAAADGGALLTVVAGIPGEAQGDGNAGRPLFPSLACPPRLHGACGTAGPEPHHTLISARAPRSAAARRATRSPRRRPASAKRACTVPGAVSLKGGSPVAAPTPSGKCGWKSRSAVTTLMPNTWKKLAMLARVISIPPQRCPPVTNGAPIFACRSACR